MKRPGANNVLGIKSGVAKQISELQPKAFATHCHAVLYHKIIKGALFFKHQYMIVL